MTLGEVNLNCMNQKLELISGPNIESKICLACFMEYSEHVLLSISERRI